MLVLGYGQLKIQNDIAYGGRIHSCWISNEDKLGFGDIFHRLGEPFQAQMGSTNHQADAEFNEKHLILIEMVRIVVYSGDKSIISEKET